MSPNFMYFVTKYVVYTSVKYLSLSRNSSKVIKLLKMVTYPHVTHSARLIGRVADDIIGKAPEAQTPNSLILA